MPGLRLVTVTSPEFLLGTRVMLDSFLAANPWFEGETVVLHARLDEAAVGLLETEFPRLTCRKESATLGLAVDRLVAAVPSLAGRRDRFLSLETLLLPASGRSLFLDSDIVVRGSLAPVLESRAALAACPDAAMLRGNERDEETLAERPALGEAPRVSFNAGMMMVGEIADPPALAARLLALLMPEEWARVASRHTDQAVWNRLFRDEVELLDEGFNLMVGHARLYPGDAVERARVLHFNGPAKPWLPGRHDPDSPALARAMGLWREAARHLRDRRLAGHRR